MVDNNTNDDFYKFLAASDAPAPAAAQTVIESPFGSDEIIIKDEHGELKVLHGRDVQAFRQTDVPPAEPRPQAPVSPQPPVVPRTPPPVVASAPTEKSDRVIQDIVVSLGIQLDDQRARRLRGILLSRLKDVRSLIEAREALTADPAKGGVGLDVPTAEKVLQLLQRAINQLASDAVLLDSTVSSIRSTIEQSFPEPEPPQLSFEKSTPLAPVAPSPVEPPLPLPPTPLPARPAPLPTPVPSPVAEVAVPSSESQPPRKPMPISGGARPKIEDVKFKPKALGPVEEIQSLTLVDFRRMSQDPAEAVQRIKEKIMLLEKESFTEKIKAIRAWQQSEINQLYVQVGHQSMAEQKSIEQILGERQSRGEPTLTTAEFEAVSDLNQQLRH